MNYEYEHLHLQQTRQQRLHQHQQQQQQHQHAPFYSSSASQSTLTSTAPALLQSNVGSSLRQHPTSSASTTGSFHGGPSVGGGLIAPSSLLQQPPTSTHRPHQRSSSSPPPSALPPPSPMPPPILSSSTPSHQQNPNFFPPQPQQSNNTILASPQSLSAFEPSMVGETNILTSAQHQSDLSLRYQRLYEHTLQELQQANNEVHALKRDVHVLKIEKQNLADIVANAQNVKSQLESRINKLQEQLNEKQRREEYVEKALKELQEEKERYNHLREYYFGDGNNLRERRAAAAARGRHRGGDGDEEEGIVDGGSEDIEYNKETIELQNIRIKSLEEIISIQQKEILNDGKEKRGTPDHEGETLLTRWREKVFALLVQQKAAQLEQKKIEEDHNKQVNELKEKIKTLEYAVARHQQKECDLSASLQIANTGKNIAQGTIKKLEQRERRLVELINANREDVRKIFNMIKKFEAECAEQVLAEFYNQLHHMHTLSKRVEFAVGRVKILKGMVKIQKPIQSNKAHAAATAKEAPSQQQQQQSSTSHMQAHHHMADDYDHHATTAAGISEKQLQEEVRYLHKEVERLTAERNFLANKLKQSAHEEQSRLQSTNEKFTALLEEKDAQIKSLMQQLEQVTHDLHMANDKCKMLENSLVTAQSSIESNLSEIKELKVTMKQMSINAERERDASVRNAIYEYEESLIRLRNEYDELKKNFTKQSIINKTLERQIAKQKEVDEVEESRKFEHYEMKLQAKDNELRMLRKERNALLASLRQQERMGLMASPSPLSPSASSSLSMATKPQQQPTASSSILAPSSQQHEHDRHQKSSSPETPHQQQQVRFSDSSSGYPQGQQQATTTTTTASSASPPPTPRPTTTASSAVHHRPVIKNNNAPQYGNTSSNFSLDSSNLLGSSTGASNMLNREFDNNTMNSSSSRYLSKEQQHPALMTTTTNNNMAAATGSGTTWPPQPPSVLLSPPIQRVPPRNTFKHEDTIRKLEALSKLSDNLLEDLE